MSKQPDTHKNEYLLYDSIYIKFKTDKTEPHCLGIYTWGKTINKSKEVNITEFKTVIT